MVEYMISVDGKCLAIVKAFNQYDAISRYTTLYGYRTGVVATLVSNTNKTCYN